MVILQCLKKISGPIKKLMSQENDFQVLRSTFIVGWHVGKYEKIVYLAWKQKIREIDFFYGDGKMANTQ